MDGSEGGGRGVILFDNNVWELSVCVYTIPSYGEIKTWNNKMKRICISLRIITILEDR